MKNSTIADLAWLAGIIDGEGCIMVGCNSGPSRKNHKRGTTYSLTLKVQSCDPFMAKKCHSITEEGSVSFKPNYGENRSGSLTWLCGGKAANRVLKEVLPYLVVKRKQAEMAIDFQSNYKKPFNIMKDSDYDMQATIYQNLRDEKINLKIGANYELN